MPHAALPLGLLTFAAALVAAGCAPPAAPPSRAADKAATKAAGGHDHDHGHEEHEHPESLAAGIAQVKRAAADVKAHLANGANEAADDVVHGMGHLVEDIEGLLSKEKLSDAGKTAVKKALAELFDCFDKLDTALHAPPGKGDAPAEVHASLSQRIEDAIRALEAAR
jgi:molecular chaperone GrpE (heat shock protein)